VAGGGSGGYGAYGPPSPPPFKRHGDNGGPSLFTKIGYPFLQKIRNLM